VLKVFNLRKALKVFMEDSQKWWSGNANFLWKTARWFSGDSSKCSRKFLMLLGVFTEWGRHCDLYWHLRHFQSLEIWPPNVQLFIYQVLCTCQHLSCIAFVSEPPNLWQSTPQLFLSTAAYYSVHYYPYWRQNSFLDLLSTPPEK